MEKHLHLGWRTDKNGRWVQVNLYGSGMAAHTAVIAQSGSGKSFTLGRLLEEIVGKTRARILILDPNSDFAKFSVVNTDVFSTEKKPDLQKYLVAGEADSFLPLWRELRFSVLSQRKASVLGLAEATNAEVCPISISWSALTLQQQASYLGLSLQTTPAECRLLEWVHGAGKEFAKSHPDEPYTLEQRRKFAARLRARALNRPRTNANSPPWPDLAALSVPLDTDDSGPLHTVHGRMLHLETLNIFDQAVPGASIDIAIRRLGAGAYSRNVVCLDLGSLDKPEEQHLVASAALEALWHEARASWLAAIRADKSDDKRCPTFIVVDEAHNLAPASPSFPSVKPVADALVRIAMEGRKYGLFLILVTQRPARLNENLFSQCDNLCLMKMSNHADLALVEKTFGFLPAGIAQRALDFAQGQMLLAGKFIERETIAARAPRRTLEGGRSLQDTWLESPSLPLTPPLDAATTGTAPPDAAAENSPA